MSSSPSSIAVAAPSGPLWFNLQGLRRRLLYVSVFEGLAIACTSWGLSLMSGQDLAHAGVMGLASSAIAVLWNFLFNACFERWEARQARRGRSLARRVAHAAGFEGGLVLSLVPLFAWWFGVSLWQAFVMDLGLILFFLGYTFVFNWGFDRLFGLPASAAPQAA